MELVPLDIEVTEKSIARNFIEAYAKGERDAVQAWLKKYYSLYPPQGYMTRMRMLKPGDKWGHVEVRVERLGSCD